MRPWPIHLPLGVTLVLMGACGKPTAQIVAGQSHTCQLFSDGGVLCWGANPSGQGTPPEGVRFQQLSAAAAHTCGVDDERAIHCWGNTDRAALAYDPGPFTMVETGNFHTCALDPEGVMRCWGPDPLYRQHDCGQGIPGPALYKEISAGGLYNCAVRQDGGVKCWFEGNGRGCVTGSGHWLVQAPERNIAQVSAAYWNTCVITTDNMLDCVGQIFREPWLLPEGERFMQIDLMIENGCGIDLNRELVCWGPDISEAPRGEWAQVAVGERHACAMDLTGRATCWGNNEEGQTDVPY